MQKMNKSGRGIHFHGIAKPYNIRQKTSTSDMSKYQMTVGQKKKHSYRKKHLAEPGSGRGCHIQQLLIHTTLK